MPVENLFGFARVRREAERLGIISIDRVGESLAVKLGEKARVEPGNLLKLLEENKSASFSPTGVLKIKMDGRGRRFVSRQGLHHARRDSEPAAEIIAPSRTDEATGRRGDREKKRQNVRLAVLCRPVAPSPCLPVSPALWPVHSALRTNWPRRTIWPQNLSHPRTDKYDYASQTNGACHHSDLWRFLRLQVGQVIVFGVFGIAG